MGRTGLLLKGSIISEIIWSKKLKGYIMAEIIWSKVLTSNLSPMTTAEGGNPSR